MVGIKGTHGMEASRVEGIRIERKAARQRTRRGLGIMALMASVGLMVGLGAETSGAMDAPLMILPGQVDVSARGDASYTIPIAVPPGTGGMVPPLALEYSSHGGNGIMGLGFSLTGIPAVGRCPRTVAQDGVRGSVNYTGSDRFCLEGQRLVATSGTYGANGTEYRTELEGFSKIISYGTAGTGPAWFKVWTKSGQIMEFGNTTNSRFLAQGKTTARSWGLNKVTDTVGNYLTVTYQNDTTNGQAYPTRIDYTGNAGASLTPYNSVRFVYNTNRPDKVPHYHAGSLQKTTVLLTNVQTYAGATRVSDYKITYELGNNIYASRVTQIELCDGGSPATCLPPTSFTWQDNRPTSGNKLSFSQALSINLTGGTGVPSPAHFTSDGRTDVVITGNACTGSAKFYKGTASFSFSTFGITLDGQPACITQNGPQQTDQDWHLWYLVDTNGDGLTDLLKADYQEGDGDHGPGQYDDGDIKVYRNNAGSSFVSMADIDHDDFSGWVAGDFNGDGYADYGDESGSSVTIKLGNGAGGFTSGPTFSAGTDATAYGQQADFDGNGCTDLVVRSRKENNQGNWSDDGRDIVFFCNAQASSLDIESHGIKLTGDWNGDGKADIADNANAVRLSKGVTFTGSQSTLPTNASFAGDWNGDGRTDVAKVVGTTVTMYLSTGTSFVQDQVFTAPGGLQNVVPADWNSDGATDLWFVTSSGDRIYTTPYVPELITGITNGLGIDTTITYDRINKHGSLYTKLTNATYPTVDVNGPHYVVSRLDVDDGVVASPGTYSSTYSYKGLKADRNGRGFLGFKERTVTDLETGIVQKTVFRQDWPYLGLVSSETKSLGATVLNTTTNSYSATNLGSGRRFVKLTSTVEESRDLDGTVLPPVTTAYTYDSYGNALTVKVSTPDGASKVTTNTYTNNTTNWLLGRLTAATVTSTVTQPVPGGGVNGAPNAVNDSVSVNYQTAKTFDPRGNDTDPDGDTLTITEKTNGSKGSVTILSNGTQLRYTPNSGATGADSFTYRIVDLRGGWDDATVTVDIDIPDELVRTAGGAYTQHYTANPKLGFVVDTRTNTTVRNPNNAAWASNNYWHPAFYATGNGQEIKKSL